MMDGPFHLRPDRRIEARLTPTEAQVLQQTAEQVRASVARPSDPSSKRLFPPG